MNKTTIGNYLLVLSLGFILGFFTFKHSGNFFGEVPSKQEEILLHKLDSLENLQTKSDTIIVKIKETKIKLHTEYVQDTIYINQLPFDSLKSKFLSEYPR